MSYEKWCRTWTVWCFVTVVVAILVEVTSLSGPNVCMVHQKYNITKRVKYRAPMSVRTYVWCFSVPPRCSKWSTEMRDLTRLETEERTAEVAVCCPGYKMKDVSCVPICPNGRTGQGCSEECPPNKWGPNCVHECVKCLNGFCSPKTGECDCLEGWQGESCQISMSTTRTSTTLMEELLTTTKSSVQTPFTTKLIDSTTSATSKSTTTSVPTIITPSTITTKQFPTTAITSTATFSSTLLTTPKTDIYNNITLAPSSVWIGIKSSKEVTETTESSTIYNRTEISTSEGTSTYSVAEHVISTTTTSPIITKANSISMNTSTSTTTPKTTTQTIEKETVKTEALTTKKLETKLETTTKNQITTIKLRPKEIWIKPMQKGDAQTQKTETKVKVKNELSVSRHKNEITENTTPKTIIVSIIPTSISHATFKKIALTTSSYIAQKTNATSKFYKKIEQGFTKPIKSQTSTAMPFTIKILPSKERNLKNSSSIYNISEFTSTTINEPIRNVSENINPTTKPIINTTLATSKTTNSMSTITETSDKQLNFSLITNKPLINKKINQNFLSEVTTKSIFTIKTSPAIKTFHKYAQQTYVTEANIKVTKTLLDKTKYVTRRNTKIMNVVTTEEPVEDQFHILTEPEHITAVMSDKERDHSSADLISVISIAGGVMMTVITVAIIIVMVDRCKRPNYEDTRKMNEFRMHAMIDNDNVSPPYVRSIFHTPLPDPPSSDKCHYQPISTLDRNLKQFMRPVVVQNISPIMLENFRGILECHYDHLPRRNYEFEAPLRASVPPSLSDDDELRLKRPLSIAETIEALKCEAKLDVLDTTTSEPLYAEIPCWRPPSEHAVEILNLNGEAVTEL